MAIPLIYVFVQIFLKFDNFFSLESCGAVSA